MGRRKTLLVLVLFHRTGSGGERRLGGAAAAALIESTVWAAGCRADPASPEQTRQLVSCCQPERGSKENWRARAPEEFAILRLRWGVSTFSVSTSVTCADFLHSVSLRSLIHLVLLHIHTYIHVSTLCSNTDLQRGQSN